MASLFLAAELMGRQRSAIIALVLAAAIMVGISPYLLGNAAFQLSFLAMAGLVFMFPAFRAAGRSVVKRIAGEQGTAAAALNLAGDSLSVTMAALVAVWPVVAYYFGVVSLAGPLATFLALPVLPPLIIAGALAGVVGLAFLPLAQVAGWALWLFVSYLLLVVDGLAALPFVSLGVDGLNSGWLWLYYSLLAAAVLLLRRRPASAANKIAVSARSGIHRSLNLVSRLPVKIAIPALSTIAVLVWAAFLTLPDERLHVSFLDVGQGDAILVQYS
jgi:competence protein ComEC